MSQTNPNQLPPKSNKAQQIMTKVVVPIVVAIVGGTGFWQYLQNQNDSPDCQIKANDISLSKTIIEVNQTLTASIRVDNPDGKALLYNWQGKIGKMNPDTRSPSPQSTYTAPSNSVDDTISVDVTLPGCNPVRKSKQIAVTPPSSSTQTPPKTSTQFPSTPPINPSPSPKPTQQTRVVFEEDFEGNLTSGNYTSNYVAITEGNTGKGLTVSYPDKSEERGARSFQLPGVFETGKTYQASALCKANKRAKCRISLVDDTRANNTEPYENEVNGFAEGNGDWQKITTPARKMSHDEYMSVYVYSTVLGTSATYDDILVEEVVTQ